MQGNVLPEVSDNCCCITDCDLNTMTTISPGKVLEIYVPVTYGPV